MCILLHSISILFTFCAGSGIKTNCVSISVFYISSKKSFITSTPTHTFLSFFHVGGLSYWLLQTNYSAENIKCLKLVKTYLNGPTLILFTVSKRATVDCFYSKPLFSVARLFLLSWCASSGKLKGTIVHIKWSKLVKNTPFYGLV